MSNEQFDQNDIKPLVEKILLVLSIENPEKNLAMSALTIVLHKVAPDLKEIQYHTNGKQFILKEVKKGDPGYRDLDLDSDNEDLNSMIDNVIGLKKLLESINSLSETNPSKLLEIISGLDLDTNRSKEEVVNELKKTLSGLNGKNENEQKH